MQLKPGTTLQNGKYEIVRTLGQGGFGITYLARHTLMERLVCIKEFFVKEYCDRNDETSQVSLGSKGNAAMMRQYMEKFMKEAKTVAKLEHPHIVKIHDVFKENNTSYAVMEYIDGCSLAEYVREHGPIPEKKAVEYIRQVCDALIFAHARKVMHLDVKPSNIMLSEDMTKATLIDFGMAKQYADTGEQTSGTPVGLSHGYAPLEQYLEGGVKVFSPATDVYALGATLYFLLTGKRPAQANELALQGGLKSVEGPFSVPVKNAIVTAMRYLIGERPQNIDAFLKILNGGEQAEDDEKTVVPKPKPSPNPLSKPEPKPEPTQPTGSPEKPKSKVWLWALLACAVVAAIITAIVLGGRQVSDPTGIADGHGYVDLGLSVKWATCNVGASSPSHYGNYFAWGETSIKAEYRWDTYKYGDHSKYNMTDKKTVLDQSDDVASVQWGGGWRMPTQAEMIELRDNCTWRWTRNGGRKGFQVKSKLNGKSIFLPAAGYVDNQTDYVDKNPMGYYSMNHCVNYWSSSSPLDLNLSLDNHRNSAQGIFYVPHDLEWNGDYRYRFYGHPVRPVIAEKKEEPVSVETSAPLKKSTTVETPAPVGKPTPAERPTNGTINGHDWVDLGLPSGIKWATCNVGASSPSDRGSYFSWGETKPKSEYTWSTLRYCADDSGDSFTKYNTLEKYGTVDNKKKLEMSDDAARANWGGSWRMPTDTEWAELLNNCTSTWTTQNGVN